MNDPLEILAGSIDRESVEREIAQLDQEITERAQRINKLRVLLSLLPEEASAGRSAAADDIDLGPVKPTLADAILRVMAEGGRDAAWSGDEVLTALVRRDWAPGGKTPRNSVDATLSRLRKDGKVERVAHGTYRLSSAQAGEDGAAGNSAATLLDHVEEV